MARPAVDVVLPFGGRDDELAPLLSRLGRLRRGAADRVIVADNRRGGGGAPGDGVEVVPAAGERSPAFARNRGAAAGGAQWLVFLDADVEPEADLLDRYFEPAPGERTAVLAGALRTEAPADGRAPAAARYAHARGFLDARRVAGLGRWAFAQTANCAVRRAAFQAVGGFTEGIRAGEDADLCWRLAAAGWEMEARAGARAVHRPRQTVRGLIGQMAVHGGAAGWLERTWPGSFPPASRAGLAAHCTRQLGRGLAGLARGDADAVVSLLDPVAFGAYEAGRLGRNRPRR
jgi:hypothetical protein